MKTHIADKTPYDNNSLRFDPQDLFRLKECECCFDHKKERLYKMVLNMFRENPSAKHDQ